MTERLGRECPKRVHTAASDGGECVGCLLEALGEATIAHDALAQELRDATRWRDADVVALKNVSGALMDAGTIPVSGPETYGDSVRALTKERDALAQEAFETGIKLEAAEQEVARLTEQRNLFMDRADAAEQRARVLEAVALEQWEAAHAEHCRHLDVYGQCPAPPPMGCQWPLPAALTPPSQPGGA